MDEVKARAIALEYLEKIEDDIHLRLSGAITRKNDIYLFHYNSEAFVEGDELAMLIGLGPNIIDGKTGHVAEYTSAYSDIDAIANYYQIRSGFIYAAEKWSDFRLSELSWMRLEWVKDIKYAAELFSAMGLSDEGDTGETVLRTNKTLPEVEILDRIERGGVEFGINGVDLSVLIRDL